MTVTALPARTGTALNGGYGSAKAAKEALTRDLSAELAPHGIRAVSLRPHGMPETKTMKQAFELKASLTGTTWEQFQTFLANWSHPRRVMKLDPGGTSISAGSARPISASFDSIRIIHSEGRIRGD
jgi:NAD(P)-dependent dehydrogenase (short-subunit alcohol dehydrogenase family)